VSPKDRTQKETIIFHGIFRVKNGWIFLGARDSDYERIAGWCSLPKADSIKIRELLLEKFLHIVSIKELNNSQNEIYPYIHPIENLDEI